jgi:agmatine deiminase
MSNLLPAEWHPHDLLWIGFPHDADEWQGHIAAAQEEIAHFALTALHNGEPVALICRNEANAKLAKSLTQDTVPISIHPYGDIWLRDTGPLITFNSGDNGQQTQSERTAQLFRFNGWGGKYLMPGDNEIGHILAETQNLSIIQHDWILEGGAVDVDGQGWAVTTEQCLLNPNRNPKLLKANIEKRLALSLGVNNILWLGQGLINDHTDGHVDNIARWVAPKKLALASPSGSDDPNISIYADALNRAEASGIDVALIPSPGLVMLDGEIAPASHMNFVIGNNAVFLPIYHTEFDALAMQALANIFPDRKIIAISSAAILRGGGSLHCASQPLPASRL